MPARLSLLKMKLVKIRSSHCMTSVRKGVFRNIAEFTGKKTARISFLKRDSGTGVFL